MLGKRIHDLRIAMGLNQVQLAKKLNISKQTVSNWENENIQPSIEMLVRLAKFFHTSTNYLLGLEDVLTIHVDGLPSSFVAHLAQIIDDYKAKRNPPVKPGVLHMRA